MNIIISAVSQGILWGIMVIGLYISYRILDYADLTVDGSFALGGAVAVICIVNGVNIVLTVVITVMAGSFAGFITGFLHTKLGIPGILAGILTMISLYSVNVTIMNRANISLLGEKTCFTLISDKLSLSNNSSYLLVGVLFCLIIIFILTYFFKTEIGQLLRATGDNAKMVSSQGHNPENFKILGLCISNAMVALSGGLIAMQQGYADVSMGTGSIITGLASIIIGEVVFGKKHGFTYKLTSAVIGSIIYRLIIAFILYLGLKPTLLNLFTALIVAIALSVPTIKNKLLNKKGVVLKC